MKNDWMCMFTKYFYQTPVVSYKYTQNGPEATSLCDTQAHYLLKQLSQNFRYGYLKVWVRYCIQNLQLRLHDRNFKILTSNTYF